MELIKKIKENLPLLSAGLVLIGYINSYSFYYWFDINIGIYQTTTELIFSFLPLILPFLLIAISMWFLSNSLHLVIVRQEKEALNKGYYNDGTYSIPVAWDRLKKDFKKDKSALDWILFPISIGTFIISITIQIFSIMYIFIIADALFAKDPHFGFGASLILGIIWIILLYSRIAIYKKEETKKNIRSAAHILTVCLAIGIIWLYNSERADRILSGKPEFIATISLESQMIKTDTINVYVGQTNEYLFIRNIPKGENIILPKSLIKKQKIKRSKFSKRFSRD